MISRSGCGWDNGAYRPEFDEPTVQSGGSGVDGLVVQAVGSGGGGGPRRRTRRGVWVSDGDGEGETRMGEAAHGAGEEDAHGGGRRTARAAMGEAATDGIEILFFFNGGRGIGGRGGADGRKPNDEGRKTDC